MTLKTGSIYKFKSSQPFLFLGLREDIREDTNYYGFIYPDGRVDFHDKVYFDDWILTGFVLDVEEAK